MPGDLAITLQQASPDQQGLLASGLLRGGCSTAAPSPLDHLLQGAAAGPDHSQVMHQAHHPAPGAWPSPCSAPASDPSSAPSPAEGTPQAVAALLRARPSIKFKPDLFTVEYLYNL